MAQDERTAPLSTDVARGRFSPPAARTAELTGSVSRRAAGCWPHVSSSPPTASTRQVRDSTRRPLGLPAGTPPGRLPKHDLSNWTVTDDWRERIPVTDAEVDVFEAWFGDLFDKLFGPCR